MRKSVTKIVKAVLGFTMVIGAGVGAISSVNDQATPLRAANTTIASADVVSASSYAKYQTTNWIITFGGNNKSVGTNSGNRSKCNLSSYSKYAVSPVTTSSVAAAFVSLTSINYINGISYTVGGGSNQTSTKVYAIYSSNNTTFSKLTLTTGTQGHAIASGTKVEFDTCSGYFGLLLEATNDSGNWRIDDLNLTLHEDNGGGDPEPTGFTVSFNGNGGTGSMSSVYNVSGSYTLPSNGFTVPSGKGFVGWKANNSGDTLAAGSSYNVTADVAFYAQWEDRYSVSYNSNGGSGNKITDSNSPYAPSATVTIKANTYTAPFADMVFDKWNTAADGSGQDYNPGDTFTISAATTLYAQWVDNPSIPYTNVYSTSFDSGDGFASSTDYMSEVDVGPNNNQWHVYYGTASTGSPLSGNQSLQMRWYGNYVDNLPHAETKFSSVEVKRITFKYKVSNANLDFKVQYNVDGGNSWTDIETVDTANSNVHTYRKIFDSPISILYFRILGVAGDTAPTSGNNYQFRIDDFSIDSVATPATINGNSSVQVGTQWSPTNITENAGEHNVVTGAAYSFTPSNGAVVSDSNTTTGSFTCSSAGTVTVSAVKSGYLISNKVVTIVPAESFINNLSKTSTTGFTGQNETITFSYGNLSGALSVVSNNDSVVTTSNLSQSTGSGSVQLNYVGAGSTTISFKDGSAEKASVTVTVTISSVTITGMPASKLMGNGTSLNLGAYITVSAVGTCSNTVSWSSSVNGVATVNSSGVVAAVSVGSTVVTVTPEDYPAGAVSCTVTVVNEKAILATSISSGDTVFLGSQAVSMQYNGPSSTSTVFGLGVGFAGAPNVGGIALEVEDGSVADSFALRIKSGDYADKYLTWIEENSLNVADAIDDNSSWNISIDGSGNASITNVNTPARKIWWNVTNPRFACYTGKSDGESYKYVQLWKQVNPESYYNTASTVNTIHGRENYTADVLTSVDSVVIRFGATIAKSNWDAIKASWEITDYGVMLMRKTDLDDNAYLSVQEAFEDNASSSILKIINKRAGGAAYADPYLDGDDYLFTVRVNFQDDAQYYDDVIYAVPFVVAGGQYYFFNEMHTSVQELALDYYNTGYTYLSDEALEILIGD